MGGRGEGCVGEGDLGELMVGCADCSLWLRVHFAVAEEEGGEEDGEKPSSKMAEGSLRPVDGDGDLGVER